RLSCVAPLRGSGDQEPASPGAGWGLPVRLNVFGPAFGDDPQARADASPLNHVRPGLPPFLLLSAEHDLPTLPGMAEEFQQALQGQGCDARLVTVRGRNHSSILFRAIERDDPTARLILSFLRRWG